MREKRSTKAEKMEILQGVEAGADIFSRRQAVVLRRCEKLGLVEICPAMGRYGPRVQHPFFGAITTDKGREFVADIIRSGRG